MLEAVGFGACFGRDDERPERDDELRILTAERAGQMLIMVFSGPWPSAEAGEGGSRRGGQRQL